MGIHKEQFENLSEQLIKGLPFIEHFNIDEYRRPSDEVSSFLITVKRDMIQSEINAYILLLERLEYHEEEWNWSEKLVLSSRDAVLNRILNRIDKGVFSSIDSQMLAKKILEVDIDIDVYRELTNESSNIIIFDDWNLLEIMGRNEDNYFLFTWYTTA
ncbi:hypothetical protein [Paenibacillus sp. V4I7]|uniref:hypothetical protein n=1 Tax=Paenibacillus sp. V4I7 TaxID=3042307 RepID=UPI002783EA39|nr:hypothetical protein [Paenibacillus sp. V4I7]MDQ0899422.1 hypothetical protein [Paenibacillus sp. V4I7]